MRETILVRLSMDILYGIRAKQMELWADLVGFPLSDNNALTIMLVEAEIGLGLDIEDDVILQEVFMGSSTGKNIISVIRHQLKDISSYIPDKIVDLRYLRTQGDAIYVIATRAPDLLDGHHDVLP